MDLLLNLVWEYKIDCRGISLDGLLELVLLQNVGNQWPVTAASTFTLIGPVAFTNRFG